MASIYDLTESFRVLWELMEEGNIEDSVLEDVFDNTEEDLTTKLEGYCKFIKNCESDIAGLKAEEKRLAERRRVIENTIERSKAAMQNAMAMAGEKKLPCGTFTVSVQKNPPKAVIDNLERIPQKYLIPQEPTVDKKAILDDLKENAEGMADFAHIEQGESLRIR